MAAQSNPGEIHIPPRQGSPQPPTMTSNPEISRCGTRCLVVASIGLLTALAIAATHFSEAFFRFYAYVFFPAFGAILAGIWLLFTAPISWRRKLSRLAAGIGVLAVLGVLALVLFRWEDTWGGTSLIKPIWRWTPDKDANLAEVRLSGPDLPRKTPVEGILQDWPQFLGPNRDGTLPNLQLSADWDETPPKLLWKQPIGLGWSSFAVSGRNAVTMEQRGEHELTTCYDVVTGAPVWTHANEARFEANMGGFGPRSTPAIAAGRVFTQGATGIVNCLDAETGEPLWTRNPLAEFSLGNVEWGKSNGPLLLGDDLVVVTGGNDSKGPALLAYHRETGELAWKSVADSASYSSPILTTIGGDPQIVSVNGHSVTGVDPKDGAQLWRWDWDKTNWPRVSQPWMLGGQRILVSASYGLGSYLLDVGGEKPEIVWETRKALKTKFSSALVIGDHAYGLDEGVFSCIDLKTGKRVWKGGRYGFGQNLLVGGLILIQAEDGSLALVEPNPARHVELARFQALEGTTWTVPTLAGNYLLVRNDEEAACFWVELNTGGGKRRRT